MLSHAVPTHMVAHAGVAIWIALLAVAIALQYLLPPVMLRMKPGQLPVALSPAVDVPAHLAVAEDHLREMAMRLAAIGFDATPPGLPLISTTNLAALVQVFVHRTDGNVANVIAMQSPKTGIHTVLGFTAEFGDGAACYTGNSRLPSAIPPRPKTVRHRFPSEYDAARLYALHRAVTATFGNTVQRPVQVDDSVSYQLEQEQKGRRWMIDSGYYWLDGERVRLTWKGAYLGVWRHLPPWRTLAERHDERVRRHLLRPDTH
jgi:hypothetical protein